MGVKFIKSNINPFVPGCLVDWVAIPGPHLPTLFVCHHLGGEGQSGRPVLCLPCLPCAHSPLVKPVTDCHGANEAGEDDGGIQNLSCGDPAEVDGSITPLGWQVLLVGSRRGHHTTRSKTISCRSESSNKSL